MDDRVCNRLTPPCPRKQPTNFCVLTSKTYSKLRCEQTSKGCHGLVFCSAQATQNASASSKVMSSKSLYCKPTFVSHIAVRCHTYMRESQSNWLPHALNEEYVKRSGTSVANSEGILELVDDLMPLEDISRTFGCSPKSLNVMATPGKESESSAE